MTAAISAAHALRLLERDDAAFDVVAMDPRTPGAIEIATTLANSGTRAALHLEVDADAAAEARVARDPGVIGCGAVAKLAGLAAALRNAPRQHSVTFTTVLRVAWFARATVAVRIGVQDESGASSQVVVWLARGEPLDAAYGTARGVDAVSRLVPGSVLSGPGASVVISSVVAEYETMPVGATIRCSMPTLLDLLDDDAPILEVIEEEIVADLWTDGGWPSAVPDDPSAQDLAIRAAELDGVLEVLVLDASGSVVASVGGSSSAPTELATLWSALAVAVATATPDDAIQEVLVSSEETFDVIHPLYDEARVLHTRFARRHTNYALAGTELRRICEGRRTLPPGAAEAPQRSAPSSSRSITP